ncbi:hypothetical protein AAY473_006274 [Plecturocebus cupreus]
MTLPLRHLFWPGALRSRATPSARGGRGMRFEMGRGSNYEGKENWFFCCGEELLKIKGQPTELKRALGFGNLGYELGLQECHGHRARWLTPVITALWEAEASRSPKHFGRPRQVDHLRSGVRDQPDQHGETPSLLKIQN